MREDAERTHTIHAAFLPTSLVDKAVKYDHNYLFAGQPEPRPDQHRYPIYRYSRHWNPRGVVRGSWEKSK